MQFRAGYILLFCLAITLIVTGCTTDTDPDTNNQSSDSTQATEISTNLDLITPNDIQIVNRGDFNILSWEWNEPLQENQYFDVRIWREGEPNYGVAWIKDNWFPITSWLWQQDQVGEFFWSVALVEGENGQLIREVQSQPEPRRFTYTTESWMQLPDGFEHELMAFGPTNSDFSGISLGPDGNLYVTSHTGSIFIIDQLNADSPVVMREMNISPDIQLPNLVDVLFIDGDMYVAYGGAIGILSDADGDGQYEQLTDVASGFPTWQYWGHSNNQLALGSDGKIYFGIGATTDHGPLQVENEAVIMRMNPDGSELETFATGFRNPYDLVFNANGDLFTADNAPDTLTSNQVLDFFPSEELNHVVEGGHYGFPDIYPPMDHEEDAIPPITTFLPSTGSAGLFYYEDGNFPEDYHDGIFVVQYGSRFPLMGHGQEMVFVDLESDDNGSYVGEWLTFADMEGLAPVDVVANAGGDLFVVLYQKSIVLRIRYTGVTQTVDEQEQLIELGRDIYASGKGIGPACLVCHGLPSGGEINAPNLRLIGTVANERVEGLSAEEYIRQSILMPNEYIVDGYAANIMYQNYEDVLTETDIEALIAYLQTFE